MALLISKGGSRGATSEDLRPRARVAPRLRESLRDNTTLD